jgi:hypothetical protein
MNTTDIDFHLYRINIKNQKDLTIKIDGEGYHYIGFVGIDYIPTETNHTWSFTDANIGGFTLKNGDKNF